MRYFDTFVLTVQKVDTVGIEPTTSRKQSVRSVRATPVPRAQSMLHSSLEFIFRLKANVREKRLRRVWQAHANNASPI
jgi:hypothetical protein